MVHDVLPLFGGDGPVARDARHPPPLGAAPRGVGAALPPVEANRPRRRGTLPATAAGRGLRLRLAARRASGRVGRALRRGDARRSLPPALDARGGQGVPERPPRRRRRDRLARGRPPGGAETERAFAVRHAGPADRRRYRPRRLAQPAVATAVHARVVSAQGADARRGDHRSVRPAAGRIPPGVPSEVPRRRRAGVRRGSRMGRPIGRGDAARRDAVRCRAALPGESWAWNLVPAAPGRRGERLQVVGVVDIKAVNPAP